MQGGAIGQLTKFVTDEMLVKAGVFFMMIGLTLLPYGVSFSGAVIIVIILGIGTGLLQPIILSMISKYSPDREQGAILGINQSISALARVLGPLWGGFAFEFLGYEFPFLTGGLFTFITLIITILYLKSDKRKAE
jgi:predicted MFS family arabinose efflux permease